MCSCKNASLNTSRKALNDIGEIQLCAAAVRELSQRLAELADPTEGQQFDAVEYAMEATLDKLDALIMALSDCIEIHDN